MFKSWAVTKGPSLDPKDKRLAVETEDHPLDYGDFEGTIPKGEYGGGTVMLWDRGFWAADGDADKALRKGELRFTLVGEKLQGSWVLVRLRHDRERGKRTNWLLIKRHDGYEREGDGEAVLEQDRSVASGRTMDEIAAGKGRSPKPFMLGKAKSFKAERDLAFEPQRQYAQTSRTSRCSEGKAAAPRPQERHRHAGLYRAAALQEREPPAFGRRTGCMRSSSTATACSCGSRTATAVMRTRKGLDWTAKFAAVAEAAGRPS